MRSAPFQLGLASCSVVSGQQGEEKCQEAVGVLAAVERDMFWRLLDLAVLPKDARKEDGKCEVSQTLPC